MAIYLAEHGYPFATGAGAGAPGRDILNTPGLAIEVKARREFDPLAWLRQAHRNARPGELAVVCFRPDGMGPATVEQWPVLIRLSDFVQSLNTDEEKPDDRNTDRPR